MAATTARQSSTRRPSPRWRRRKSRCRPMPALAGKSRPGCPAAISTAMAWAMIMVPDQHLGIVVMTNMTESGSRFGVAMHILQQYLQQPPDDVGATLYAQTQKADAAAKTAEKKLAATRKPDSRPPLPLADYAGKYTDSYNGTASVTLEKGRLVLRLGNPDFVGDLQHWHDDTFRVSWRYRYYGDGYVTFGQDLDGAADTI